MNYPKWIYHAEYPARLVQTAEEHAASGDGWEETPQAPSDSEPMDDAPDEVRDAVSDGETPLAVPRRRGRPAKA